MAAKDTAIRASEVSGIANCWMSIGVHGDASCPELPKHVHCRNCPVYGAAAAQLFDRAAPDGYLARWTHHVSLTAATTDSKTQSAVIFRLGTEWFGLRTACVTEVVKVLPIHSL